ncbi:AraC family transcriptional regulator [Mucilaginibacter jinjuensis]|uniref:AraC family transcriptional regulator n=1 Tax=Mucilaginibacter jinjuensis TaxID=1176721 RepID=A0ABY7TE97_9SPHI|nr:AraC family transcriptional regulator [Mucilaginibacter jinjuensis]WCT14849.1 AraC family transcriptional regulator [Mucilaginibacter jinjuensis]
MSKNIFREVIPLTSRDCFLIFSRSKTDFNFPVHNHDAIELNLILNAAGAKRVVGNHEETISDKELVLLGRNTVHGWFKNECKSDNIKEVTVQIHHELLSDEFLKRTPLSNIKRMLENSESGVAFSPETIDNIAPRLLALAQKNSFDSIMELLSIIHQLSNSHNQRILSNPLDTAKVVKMNNTPIERIFEYINIHFAQRLTLEDVAGAIGITPASLSRFVKMSTGLTFTDNLNEIRLGHVSRMLIETTHSISEVAFECGFNNLANFNRIFKKRNKCTPGEFRTRYFGQRTFI